MSDVLDQSEVDALLAAVDSGEVEEETESLQIFSRTRRDLENVEVRSYDFKRPERVSKDQMRAIETLHETFSRSFGAALSGFLRTIVEVSLSNCEQMTYSEFTAGLPNPTSFNLVGVEQLEGQICLEISPLIIYPIIDRLLGGTTQELFIPQRPMTAIERRLIGQVLERAIGSLSEAWSSVRDLAFIVGESESNPQLVQIVPPNEVVVVVGFEIKMANRAGTMNLCIPYAVIEPLMDDIAAQSWFNTGRLKGSGAHANTIQGQLSEAVLTVTGLLAETTITVQDLLDLSVGDLIMTEKAANRPVVLCVEDEPKLLANLGQHKGNRALKVDREIHVGERVI
ncbi:MAG: flagellar motor switch protein FliM [Planctomycetota bacterium]